MKIYRAFLYTMADQKPEWIGLIKYMPKSSPKMTRSHYVWGLVQLDFVHHVTSPVQFWSTYNSFKKCFGWNGKYAWQQKEYQENIYSNFFNKDYPDVNRTFLSCCNGYLLSNSLELVLYSLPFLSKFFSGWRFFLVVVRFFLQCLPPGSCREKRHTYFSSLYF